MKWNYGVANQKQCRGKEGPGKYAKFYARWVPVFIVIRFSGRIIQSGIKTRLLFGVAAGGVYGPPFALILMVLGRKKRSKRMQK